MPSTYSPSLQLELIGTGDQAGTWGTTTNTNFGTLLDQAIAGYTTQAVSTGTDTTLVMTPGASAIARNMYIELTGTGGTNTNLIVPSNEKLYFIFNNTSSGQVTVKVSGQTGVSVANNTKLILVSNGTDIINATSYVTSSGGGGTVTSVAGTGNVNGITLTGTVTTAGNLTLGGTLSGTASALNIGGNAATATAASSASFATTAGTATSATTATTASAATTLSTGSWLGFQSGATLAYNYLGSPRATLDSAGNWAPSGYTYGNELFINTFTTLGGYGAKCNILYNSSSQAGIVTQAQTATSNNAMLFLNNAGTAVGSIFVSSTNTTFNDLSDYRLKNSIAPMTGALAKVALLKPCTYKWNYDDSDSQGFIAHELQEVVPECVTGEKDALNENGSIKAQGIDTSKLVATLTAAIQELKALVDTQATRIATLESR